jgi:hypothetical protein
MPIEVTVEYPLYKVAKLLSKQLNTTLRNAILDCVNGRLFISNGYFALALPVSVSFNTDGGKPGVWAGIPVSFFGQKEYYFKDKFHFAIEVESPYEIVGEEIAPIKGVAKASNGQSTTQVSLVEKQLLFYPLNLMRILQWSSTNYWNEKTDFGKETWLSQFSNQTTVCFDSDVLECITDIIGNKIFMRVAPYAPGMMLVQSTTDKQAVGFLMPVVSQGEQNVQDEGHLVANARFSAHVAKLLEDDRGGN